MIETHFTIWFTLETPWWTQQAPQIASEGLVPSSKAAPQTTAAISAAMSTLE